MKPQIKKWLCATAALLAVLTTPITATAQPQLCLMAMAQTPLVREASPTKEAVKRWLNLSSILHIEASDSALKIYTTIGGNAGSKPTYEIAVRSMDEAFLWVSKIQSQAKSCQTEMFPLPPLPSNTPVPKFLPKEAPYK